MRHEVIMALAGMGCHISGRNLQCFGGKQYLIFGVEKY
jgi:hypothetical protein